MHREAGTASERASTHAAADRISKNDRNTLSVIGVGNGCDSGELPAAIHKSFNGQPPVALGTVTGIPEDGLKGTFTPCVLGAISAKCQM
jgi:hypothetical protein